MSISLDRNLMSNNQVVTQMEREIDFLRAQVESRDRTIANCKEDNRAYQKTIINLVRELKELQSTLGYMEAEHRVASSPKNLSQQLTLLHNRIQALFPKMKALSDPIGVSYNAHAHLEGVEHPCRNCDKPHVRPSRFCSSECLDAWAMKEGNLV